MLPRSATAAGPSDGLPDTVVADDLTGAAEAAAVLHESYGQATLCTSLRESPAGATAISLAIRDKPPDSATIALLPVLRRLEGRRLFFKVDSQLRGPLPTILDIAGRARSLVLATALPAQGRVVRDGEPFVDGLPLRESAAWAVEDRPAPPSMSHVAPPNRPVAVVPLETVRSPALAAALATNARTGRISACDAETEQDLALIARAACPYSLVGSSALLRAALRPLAGPADLPREEHARQARSAIAPPQTVPSGALVVIGTMDPTTRAEARLAVGAGNHLTIDPLGLEQDALIDDACRALAAGRSVVLTTAIRSRRRDLAVSTRLADIASRVLRRAPADTPIAILGGETAHALLARLTYERGREALQVRGQVHVGATVLSAPDGRAILLRPGSFTDGTSLSSILDHLTHPTPR